VSNLATPSSNMVFITGTRLHLIIIVTYPARLSLSINRIYQHVPETENGSCTEGFLGTSVTPAATRGKRLGHGGRQAQPWPWLSLPDLGRCDEMTSVQYVADVDSAIYPRVISANVYFTHIHTHTHTERERERERER